MLIGLATLAQRTCMKPPSGECNGDIGAADISENKNVTPALSVLSAWGTHSEWTRAGLGDLAGLLRPPAPPFKPDRGVERYRGISSSTRTCSSIYGAFGWRSGAVTRLIYSAAYRTLVCLLECCSKQFTAPSVVSGAYPDRAVLPRNSLNDKRSRLQ